MSWEQITAIPAAFAILHPFAQSNFAGDTLLDPLTPLLILYLGILLLHLASGGRFTRFAVDRVQGPLRFLRIAALQTMLAMLLLGTASVIDKVYFDGALAFTVTWSTNPWTYAASSFVLYFAYTVFRTPYASPVPGEDVSNPAIRDSRVYLFAIATTALCFAFLKFLVIPQ